MSLKRVPQLNIYRLALENPKVTVCCLPSHCRYDPAGPGNLYFGAVKPNPIDPDGSLLGIFSINFGRFALESHSNATSRALLELSERRTLELFK